MKNHQIDRKWQQKKEKRERWTKSGEKIQKGLNTTWIKWDAVWRREDTGGIVEVDQLTLEYCLRRLKRCTILNEGSPHTWNSCSSLLRSYITTKCTLFHIVRTLHSQVHTEGALANLLFKYLYAHTCLEHIVFFHYANMCRGGGRGGEENEKREGEHAEIKTAQLCCPQLIFTMIPWVGCLDISYRRTLWRMRDAHTAELSKQKMISSRPAHKSHRHTQPTTSSSQ